MPIGDWHGVTTDGRGRVVELRLFDNDLRGEIPPELGDLISLRLLNLSGNQLRGEMPTELGNLSYLTELDLSWNQLSGEIPLDLRKLSILTVLDLSMNNLSGEIPPELGRLTNLTVAYLNGNELTGCIPVRLRSVPETGFSEIGLKFCDVRDRAALVALYNATDGSNWGNDANWLSDEP